ncbi:50S ribosomal protein L20 [Entomospira culicis]|uniref:Large ribosomal subunit protein bL20 n=1 Tax=Entomospira culicis TaxID=2719989 RepID=A0A968GEJ6_9SPIO|nr:50S ribosomal protein L20 [Entomospira culicis]NIZ18848.1 50S ribosomal protein L20 [Entomospira culicis]NIZ69063.1 50S ribosomal protein L20 [Entomospira culicis]WDI37651.1 50S ribosomal protein L20 [Entomospira culicis]WDI39279.1 50S ribosomal protein L20 [Entomospira culicis]
MPRAVDGTRRKNRRNKILKQAKGYWGTRSKLHRVAKTQLMKSGIYAYRDRRAKKRDFRSLWIARISAGARSQDMSYSRFMDGLKKANIQLNRKALSNLLIEDAKAFESLVVEAKKALA